MGGRYRALLTAATVLALAAGPAVVPAAAEPGSPSSSPSASATPRPPAGMSEVGGSLLGKPGPQVQLKSGAPALPEKLTGRAWIVADAASGDVLAANNPHWRLAPASTLKMLFADTLLPKFDAGRKYRVKDTDLLGIGSGSSMVGIKEKAVYTVADLWRGVFLRSGNDAVHVLCAMNGGTAGTVAEMQARARKLGALDTSVKSPDGYDMPGQVSSAYDLTLFARSGLRNADFRRYAGTASASFPGEMPKKGKKRESFAIQNTNRLLGGYPDVAPYPGIIGVKNGYTTHAGNTFTGAATRGDRTLLVTVLHPDGGHQEVYTETAALLDWGFAAAGKVEPVGSLDPQRKPSGGEDAGAGGSAEGSDEGASDKAAPVPAGGSTVGTVLWITTIMGSALAAAVWYVQRRRLPAGGN